MRNAMTLKCDLFSKMPLTDQSGDCVEYSESGFYGSLVQSIKSLNEDFFQSL